MFRLIKSTTGAYLNTQYVRDFFIDNNGPTDWYVAAHMSNDEIIAVVDGLGSQSAAESAVKEIADALGYLNVADLL
jgi:hypothetical protein